MGVGRHSLVLILGSSVHGYICLWVFQSQIRHKFPSQFLPFVDGYFFALTTFSAVSARNSLHSNNLVKQYAISPISPGEQRTTASQTVISPIVSIDQTPVITVKNIPIKSEKRPTHGSPTSSKNNPLKNFFIIFSLIIQIIAVLLQTCLL